MTALAGEGDPPTALFTFFTEMVAQAARTAMPGSDILMRLLHGRDTSKAIPRPSSRSIIITSISPLRARGR